MRNFIEIALIIALLTQQIDVAEYRRHDLVALRQPFISQ